MCQYFSSNFVDFCRFLSAECRIILQQMWDKNLGTQAGVHFIEGVRLIWGLLNTSFTVSFWRTYKCTYSMWNLEQVDQYMIRLDKIPQKQLVAATHTLRLYPDLERLSQQPRSCTHCSHMQDCSHWSYCKDKCISSKLDAHLVSNRSRMT